ncbi:TIM barrel protein, partial [Selenomonas sp.]|uniref:sugar phosphate isomerase/epimerase family protein n=1 Tax=Selenomonas sp. TaxID=2053611 RepID=UPI001CB215DB|nr:isomerase [Selenomonas sp.]
MKISMNQATCLEKSSLAKDMELCEKYGFDMIEPRTMDGIPNYLKNHTIEDLAAALKRHKLEPLAFNTLCFFNNRSPEDYAKVLDELRQMCEWGKVIGCK